MHVTVSNTFPKRLRPLVEALVRAGFHGVECDDVEAHVKARSKHVRRYLSVFHIGGEEHRQAFRRRRDALYHADVMGGKAYVYKAPNPRADGWTARAYDGVPGIANVSPDARYLVTFMLPPDPSALSSYPKAHQDPRLKTSPVVVYENWCEELVHIAAHEARHIHQFRHELSKSELDAERWAAHRLDRWRTEGDRLAV